MIDAYNKMIICFAESQNILRNQSFSVFYDEQTMEIKDASTGKMGKISYFSDFIFMQQLMTLEIDIIVGITEETLQHGSEEAQKQKITKKRFDQNASFDMNTQGGSNMMKIKALEREMIKFVTIFKKTTNEDMNVNETIQDEQRLRQMEK